LPLIFAFIFFVPCVLVSFDALPINLFIPGLVAYNSDKSSLSEYEDNEGESTKPLFSSVEKPYTNIGSSSTQELIKNDLNGLSGVYSFTHIHTGKMYIGSSINI
jgi:hypothetical protein